MKKYHKDYILKLLEYQKTKLQCINLGFTKSKEIQIEVRLIDECLKELKEALKGV